MKAIDEEILDAYVRSLTKAAEYQNKFINPVELKALIRRFMTLNTNVDPRVIDWVGVWDDRLTYTELLETFQRNYPMYRWYSEKPIDEEAFKHAKRSKLETLLREIKDLDEESLRELIQKLGELSKVEQKQEPVAQKAVQKAAPTQQMPTQSDDVFKKEVEKDVTLTQPSPPTTPKITLRVLAGVPVLLEARAFASAFEVSELLENNSLIEKTKKRLQTSVKGFPWPFGDPLEDLLTFGLGMLIVSQIRDRRVWERWAEAEAKRIEAFLNLSDNGILEAVWKDLIIRAERCNPEEERRTGFPFKIHVTDYFRLVKGIEGVEWRQKRTVSRGWVYVHRTELIRLLSEEAKLRILRKLETAPRVQIKMVQKIVEEVRQTLALT
jgi:hypothetical protein